MKVDFKEFKSYIIYGWNKNKFILERLTVFLVNSLLLAVIVAIFNNDFWLNVLTELAGVFLSIIIALLIIDSREKYNIEKNSLFGKKKAYKFLNKETENILSAIQMGINGIYGSSTKSNPSLPEYKKQANPESVKKWYESNKDFFKEICIIDDSSFDFKESDKYSDEDLQKIFKRLYIHVYLEVGREHLNYMFPKIIKLLEVSSKTELINDFIEYDNLICELKKNKAIEGRFDSHGLYDASYKFYFKTIIEIVRDLNEIAYSIYQDT